MTFVSYRRYGLVALLLGMVFLAACARPIPPPEKPVCQEECGFEGVQCIGDGFYACVDKNKDGCMEKESVELCDAGTRGCPDTVSCDPTPARCADTLKCADGKTVRSKTDLETRGVTVEKGAVFVENGQSCTVTLVYEKNAIVRCAMGSATQDRYRLECTAGCEQGASVGAQSYRLVGGDDKPHEIVASLKNEDAQCSMTCAVYQGMNYENGKPSAESFRIANRDSNTVTLRTDTPTSMMVICRKVPDLKGLCSDRIAEVLTSRFVGAPKTVQA